MQLAIQVLIGGPAGDFPLFPDTKMSLLRLACMVFYSRRPSPVGLAPMCLAHLPSSLMLSTLAYPLHMAFLLSW